MSLRPPTQQLSRLVRQNRAQCLRLHSPILHQWRTLSSKPPNSSVGPSVDPVTLHRLQAQRRAYYKRRSYYATAGFIFGMIAIYVTATSISLDNSPSGATKLDSNNRPDDPIVVLGRERKVMVQKLGEEPVEKVDQVETGTNTVPFFPRIIEFYDNVTEGSPGTESTKTAERLVEYQLVGLGIRTVSFLSVQVYVVGLYIATDDIAAVQEKLVRKIDPIASTLVAGEKEKLRGKLLDPEAGEGIWSAVLKESGARSLIRIVPTRNTDFHHLRDGWVRAITARAQNVANKEEYGDESFGDAMQQFKGLFNRGSVPKQKELLLSRDGEGKLAVWYDDGKTGAQRLGEVKDERISRAVWLNYLAGKTVASEGARRSIIDGIMQFVERPVGAVAAQVHV